MTYVVRRLVPPTNARLARQRRSSYYSSGSISDYEERDLIMRVTEPGGHCRNVFIASSKLWVTEKKNRLGKWQQTFYP